MHEPVEKFEESGYTVKLYQDEDPIDPREHDNLSVMCHWHRRYELGDRKATDTEIEALRRGGFKLLYRYLRATEGVLCVLPLGLLDHSGLHMWVGSGEHWCDPGGWDSGTVGFAYVTRKRFEELCGEYPYKPEDFKGTAEDWVEKQIEVEVEEYDKMLTGDVYGYVIEDEEENDVDSCWGFFGWDYAVESAKEAAQQARTYETEQAQKISEVCAL